MSLEIIFIRICPKICLKKTISKSSLMALGYINYG